MKLVSYEDVDSSSGLSSRMLNTQHSYLIMPKNRLQAPNACPRATIDCSDVAPVRFVTEKSEFKDVKCMQTSSTL